MKKLLADIAAKFKGEAAPETKNLALTLKDGTKVMTDSEMSLAIGQKVTKEDGTALDVTEITLEDETVITIDADGIITAIVEPAEDAAAEAVAMKEKITALEKENKELKAAAAAEKVKSEALAKDVSEMKTSIEELAQFSSTYKAKAERTQFRKTAGANDPAVVVNAVEAARAARKAREEAKNKK
jgi:hypothetical protein